MRAYVSLLLLVLAMSFDARAKDEGFADRLAAAEALANSDAARGETEARALVKESVALGDVGLEVDALRVLGFNLSIQQKSSEALAIYAEALEKNDERQFPVREGVLLRHRGVSHYDMSKEDLALTDYYGALKYFEQENAYLEAAKTQSNIGNVHYRQNNLDEAIRRTQAALTLFEQENFSVGIAGTSLNLGGMYFQSSNDESRSAEQRDEYFRNAEKSWQRAYDVFSAAGIKRGVLKSLNNLWQFPNRRREHERAAELAQKAYGLASEVGDVIEQATALRRIAMSAEAMGRYDEALSAIEESLKLVSPEDSADGYLDSLRIGTEIAEKTGDYRRAFEYLKRSGALVDARYAADIDTRVAEVTARFENERRDHELIELRREREVTALKQARDRIWRISLVVLVSMALLLAAQLAYLLRLRERKRLELERAASTDPLTGVFNRRGMLDAVGMSKAQPVGVILIDIDHFKRVNDELGHDAGDEVLRQVSARIQACLSSGELLARWGGEEFLVTHEHTQEEETIALAERIRQAIGDTAYSVANDAPAVTASVGAMAASSADWSIKVAAADRAMIEVKNSGRNRSKLGRLVTG